MRKSVCIQLFEKYLKEVSAGHGYRKYTNPAVEFTKKAKAGQYDGLSDPEYEALLDEVNEISEFWLSEGSRTGIELLQVALENIDIDEAALHKLAETLADCYAGSVRPFVAENKVPDTGRLEEAAKWSRVWQERMAEKGRSSENSSFAKTDQAADILRSPKRIYNYVTRRIYGQTEAVKAASMLLFNHVQGRRRNILFAGPTGCGKTEIWRVCRQIYPYIHIIDSTAITAQGWSGSFKLKDIFAGMSRADAEKSIFVFDEFDKFCEPKIGSSGTNFSQIEQNELLKLLEGNEMVFRENNGGPEIRIDSSSISFVFCGSFERLIEEKSEAASTVSIGFGGNLEKEDAYSFYQSEIYPKDLVKYAGVRQEIAGRINQIVRLEPMTAADYEAILLDKQMSPLRQLEQQYSIRLHVNGTTIRQLAENAEETRLGVRYLRSRIQQMLDEQMFQDCRRRDYQLEA